MRSRHLVVAAVAAAAVGTTFQAGASSHREAPFIAGTPRVDGTDFYMFRSYEAGREGFVTLIANYNPLQDAYGGPNYFALDPEALYEIHIDNDGDAMEDLTFQFQFDQEFRNVSLPIGSGDNAANVAIPLIQAGPIGPGVTDDASQNRVETYTVGVVRGGARSGSAQPLQITSGALAGQTTFRKPVDYIGEKTIADYPTYANNHIFDVSIPGCGAGRVFVGQRKEGFAINLGEVFDLIALNPLGNRDDKPSIVDDKNITSLALEVPASCLTDGDSPIIGGWTTASKRQMRVLNPAPQGPNTDLPATKGPAIEGGAWTQVSRLGMPLVNEVVIGITDKDRFNASHPSDDGQFLSYVTNPTLPALIDLLFRDAVGADSSIAPSNIPRQDLVLAFLTGIPGLNQPEGVTPSEMLRLNTAVGVTAPAEQSPLGVLALDLAGFPNGRRPVDDVTDVALRAAMGVLCVVTEETAAAFGPLVEARNCDASDAPVGAQPFTDQTTESIDDFLAAFPYLAHPLPGAVQDGQ
ncbi:DUF4331 domain-containing protein [Algiphilus sp.]|uniref:DUF4331 domain-containing protein n=1 Tax=Algiphilus sp. TaxID=1872431 RepID=UPI003BAA711E